MTAWCCEPEWRGQPAFIIAGGPSVKTQNLELLRGRRIIVINSSVHSLPWADMLFFGDSRWWREKDNKAAIDAFGGIAVTTSPLVHDVRVKSMVKVPPPGLALDKTKLTIRKTSLTAALNLAFHRGANPIVILGADGKRAKDGSTHHHKPHRWPTKTGCWDIQKKDLQSMVKPLKDKGLTVLNASPGSAWDMWPVMTLPEALMMMVPEAA